MKVDEIAMASADERRILFSDVCRQLSQKVPESMIEKDFWVCYVLERIFSSASLSKLLRFKGGTSLSKAHAVIERFSEDVDLILDWTRFLSLGDPNADRSKTKQGLFNELMNETAGRYVSGELRDHIQAALGNVCSVYLINFLFHERNIFFILHKKLGFFWQSSTLLLWISRPIRNGELPPEIGLRLKF